MGPGSARKFAGVGDRVCVRQMLSRIAYDIVKESFHCRIRAPRSTDRGPGKTRPYSSLTGDVMLALILSTIVGGSPSIDKLSYSAIKGLSAFCALSITVL